jgi:hypothetical protein
VSAHLTERDRYLVRMVGEHRVLTTDQLAALSFGSIVTARHRLAALPGLGLMRRFRPHPETGSAPWHYLLGPAGAALLGAEDRDDARWAPQVRADRQLALERSQRLGHLTGANWFFVSLAHHARTSGGELQRWMSEMETARFLYGYRPFMTPARLQASPHPDGLGVWAEDGRDDVFLLEYDTGSEHLPQLAGKLRGYAELADETSAAQVPILFGFPGPRREQNARRALAASRDAASLHIVTAAFDRRTASPADARWLPVRGGAGHPVRLTDLGEIMPDPWRLAREGEYHPDRRAVSPGRATKAGSPEGRNRHSGTSGVPHPGEQPAPQQACQF